MIIIKHRYFVDHIYILFMLELEDGGIKSLILH